ncbi:hypothetical protein [Kutzneria chonburiensis]|uniref:DUF304 domain-containing protein n=1 Tax=Kutzneria chonburiensis TaxID=1483604 RepID=A0ABV6N383_9PSEU|nr:hypothetical protein [Kutzneria chonburiensis]
MDNAQLSVAVWRPMESWQTEDKAVELRMQVYARGARNAVTGLVVSLVLAAVLVAFLRTVSAFGVVFGLNAIRLAVAGIRHQVRYSRWLPAARSLLNGTPAQRLAARIVAYKGERVVLAVGAMHLQVRPVNWGLRQVIARTGEITVVGPDADGQAVVFLDGVPTPLPAKVVAAPEPTEAEPVVPVSVNGAEDQVPNWAARRIAWLNWIPLAVALVVLAGFIALAPNSQVAVFYASGFGVLLLVVAILFLFVPSDQLRLRKLLAAGQWQAHPVTIESWKGEVRRPVGELTLVLASGYRLSIKFATTELVANISATGTLWMVGLPGDRKGAAVGIPGYPILTAARFA